MRKVIKKAFRKHPTCCLLAAIIPTLALMYAITYIVSVRCHIDLEISAAVCVVVIALIVRYIDKAD